MSKPRFVDVLLQPGEYFVGDARHRIRTLLGSCVSITLWDPERRIGAMSHFLLPEPPSGGKRAPDARYGRDALGLMIAGLRTRHVAIERCVAKVFGGGDMFPGRGGAAAQRAVGQQNGEAARELLRLHGLPVSAECLFGAGHRQIIFDVRTGHVWVRRMPVTAID
ncbi:MAG: chemotaxis protein CheD [Burkholderiaceae bacterium]